jgi:hypothetical protein
MGVPSGEPGSGAVPPGLKFVTGGLGVAGLGGNVVGGAELPEPGPLVEPSSTDEPGSGTVLRGLTLVADGLRIDVVGGNGVGRLDLPGPRPLKELLPTAEPGDVIVPLPMDPASPAAGLDPVAALPMPVVPPPLTPLPALLGLVAGGLLLPELLALASAAAPPAARASSVVVTISAADNIALMVTRFDAVCLMLHPTSGFLAGIASSRCPYRG